MYLYISFFVPFPRKPYPSEKKFRTLTRDGKVTEPEELPCWIDRSEEKYLESRRKEEEFDIQEYVEPAEVFMTVIIPAFNEEQRLTGMLEEAVNLLEREYSNLAPAENKSKEIANGSTVRKRKNVQTEEPSKLAKGWEILLIDDGSKDKTVQVAEQFTRTHLVPALPRRQSGPWTHGAGGQSVNIPAGSIRFVSLEKNRGKGGAVTHGMRHARGEYIIFADADGASDINDLPKLVSACQDVEDSRGCGVAVGSRAHMVKSEAVVRRSRLRNFLMHGFHLLLWFMTPSATAKIRDTQCGFKLFSRPSLPYIIPYMHMEGWIFDVEMLMLAEFADIPVVEVPIGWKEVAGSKLDVLKDSIGMATNLATLRFCWTTGIYR